MAVAIGLGLDVGGGGGGGEEGRGREEVKGTLNTKQQKYLSWERWECEQIENVFPAQQKSCSEQLPDTSFSSQQMQTCGTPPLSAPDYTLIRILKTCTMYIVNLIIQTHLISEFFIASMKSILIELHVLHCRCRYLVVFQTSDLVMVFMQN